MYSVPRCQDLLAGHSNYTRNHNYEAFTEALTHKTDNCLVGLDLNYRATLWSPSEEKAVMTPIVTDHVDVLITTIEDMTELTRRAKTFLEQVEPGRDQA